MGWDENYNPSLNLLFSILNTMHNWLCSSEDNVVVVHSMNGKGRAGTVIVCYLLYIGMFKEVEEALEYFKMKRTNIANVEKGLFAGIDSPSQLTYIDYFFKFITGVMIPRALLEASPTVLNSINLRNVPFSIASHLENEKLSIEVYQMITPSRNDTKLVPLLICKKISSKESRGELLMVFRCNLQLCGDIVVVCKINNTFFAEEVFRFAFHTAFIDNCKLKKNKQDMDSAKHSNVLGNNFSVELIFDLKICKEKLQNNDIPTSYETDMETLADEIEKSNIKMQDNLTQLLAKCNTSVLHKENATILSNHEVVLK
jgi:hypothetical protein